MPERTQEGFAVGEVYACEECERGTVVSGFVLGGLI